jgi:signal transduction histidine kinase
MNAPDVVRWGRALRDRLLRPSLARRIVVAQLVAQGGVAVAIVLFLTFLPHHAGMLFLGGEKLQIYTTALAALEHEPERQRALMAEIERVVLLDLVYIETERPEVGMVVRRGEAVIWRSAALPVEFPCGPAGEVRLSAVEGRSWASLSSVDDTGRLCVTLARRRNMLEFTNLQEIGDGLRNIYEGLLVVSLVTVLCAPLLLMLIWLSVRMALRPVQRLGEALARRRPDDFSPVGHTIRANELRPVVDGVNAWLARLRASQDRERDFIADAAHELRTPLTAVRVYAEALNRDPDSPPNPELTQGLLRASHRAGRLVEQMLATLRNDTNADHLTSTETDLVRLVQERMADLSPLAEARCMELTLDTQGSPRPPIRRDLMESIVDNLVGNAIKYGPPGGRVTVGLFRVGDCARLSVEDSGPGIPPEFREQVLERFWRLPGSDDAGSGLGLAIVKSAVSAHGGRMELDESPLLGGLRVRVWLPDSRRAPIADQSAPGNDR